ncbi:Outer membrane protein assembly factor BamB, contains PQQ-like beta-propeller repeat [Halorientalis persicus]|uniref:Outer membrane protein assembly factor BamB, contains PQQ-like beta-propeller repeat n=1 Tax=Halorientalis persicus TaxID=1367881 RepID=A0A1H8FMT0_9EURY|nr:PQQ-binding-like beta-propeller repeat protein [Halorientalis persicus]SEN32487.1 Outer membrane protein assembly factor BamB, contains PQQ-like beta-propeller repeat [Halorientalis persicus]
MTDQRQWSRRQWLATAGSTAAVGLAGCSSDDGSTDGTDDDGSTPGGNRGNGDTSNPGETNTQSFEGPVTADGEWPMRYLDAGNTRATEAVSGPPVPVQERWSKDVGDTVARPAVSGKTVYIATKENSCYAFDLLSGDQRWERSMGNGRVYDIAAIGDRIYVAQQGSVTALTKDNSVEWTFEDITSPADVLVSDGTVYTRSGKTLYARDAASGDELWTTTVDTGQSRPAVAGGSVLTKDQQYLRAFDAETGDQRYQVEHGGSIALNSVSVADGTAYFMADTNIEARSIEDGSLEWRWTDGAAEETPPTVADGVVYANPHGRTGPYRIDAETGENLGAIDIDGYTMPPVVADGTVFVSRPWTRETNARLYAIDAETNAVKWEMQPPDKLGQTPIVLEDLLVYGVPSVFEPA